MILTDKVRYVCDVDHSYNFINPQRIGFYIPFLLISYRIVFPMVWLCSFLWTHCSLYEVIHEYSIDLSNSSNLNECWWFHSSSFHESKYDNRTRFISTSVFSATSSVELIIIINIRDFHQQSTITWEILLCGIELNIRMKNWQLAARLEYELIIRFNLTGYSSQTITQCLCELEHSIDRMIPSSKQVLSILNEISNCIANYHILESVVNIIDFFIVDHCLLYDM